MADLTIHTYTAAESGLLVNSYLLETPDGVVVVDTNLLVSDIAALKARLAALHKPLLGVFITHAHPDHFNGALELAGDRDVPVYATGDLAFHHTHPYTADGHTGAWLATLDRLAEDLERSGVRRLLPGHGAASGPGLLAEQRRYLLFYREVVRRLAGGAPKLNDAARPSPTWPPTSARPPATSPWPGCGPAAVSSPSSALVPPSNSLAISAAWTSP